MLKITREEDAEYLKNLAAARKKSADSVHEFICGGPVVSSAPEKAVPVPPPASIVPSEPRPGSYEAFLAENSARLRLPGMVRGLGGCAVEASSLNPFTGKPHSEDPPPGTILSSPLATSYDCGDTEPKQTFEEYYAEINKKNGETP